MLPKVLITGEGSFIEKRNIIIPEAQAALDRLKYEIANETGFPLKGNKKDEMLSSQYGYMVKKMVADQEKLMADKIIIYN
jgi:hypothetical protein